MTGWFDPVQLIRTAIRVVISTIFGQFADRREAFAAVNPISDGELERCYDYSRRDHDGDFWFDFVADTGDGWNPTFAMARLLAQPDAGLATRLPRGSLLIMGGDQVYPTASREAYEDRLLHPYDEAHHPQGGAPAWPDDRRPDLFAIPGNHDWYDGLRIFFNQFCRRTAKVEGEANIDRAGKLIGGRQTHQTRSYFALKLPEGWWLWGTDSQLEGYIDQPQIDFFEFVAKTWMNEESKLILCVGSPEWAYVDRRYPERNFSSFSYLTRLVDGSGAGKRLRLVLTGDSHHYARYREGEVDYIVCGGGGAFLHPTHHLADKRFKFPYPPPGQPLGPPGSEYDRVFKLETKLGTALPALYPDRRTSSRLTAWNLFFAVWNWQLTATLAFLYLFFTWLLDFNARIFFDRTLADLISDADLGRATATYWRLVFASPWTVLLSLLSWAGYCYFADGKRWRRILLGTIHAVVQAALITLVTCAVIIAGHPPWTGFGADAASLAAAAAAAALASSTMLGLYLWFCLAALGLHWAHFSSLRIQDWKSFLRLRIAADGELSVHAIGLARVPRDRARRFRDRLRRWRGPSQPAKPRPELIERHVIPGQGRRAEP